MSRYVVGLCCRGVIRQQQVEGHGHKQQANAINTAWSLMMTVGMCLKDGYILRKPIVVAAFLPAKCDMDAKQPL